MTTSTLRIAVAGAGIVGLSTAFELSSRGHRVTVFDPNLPGRGASWAAAGMLAPAFEAAGGAGVHRALLAAGLASSELWKTWVADLSADGATDLHYRPSGSIALAVDTDGVARLHEIAACLRGVNRTAASLSSDDLDGLQPGLGPAVLEGLMLETDGWIDNRAVVRALLDRLRRSAGVELVTGPPPLRWAESALSISGYDGVVIAAGWRSPHILVDAGRGDKLPLVSLLHALEAIGPVKGHMLSLAQSPDQPLSRTVRSGSTYLVPRHDRLIVGATSEAGNTERRVDPQKVAALHHSAARLVPALTGRPILETWTGIRPGSPDHAPLIGEGSLPGAILACGHYRNGVLLAPLTANLVADAIEGERESPFAEAFNPARFVPAPV